MPCPALHRVGALRRTRRDASEESVEQGKNQCLRDFFIENPDSVPFSSYHVYAKSDSTRFINILGQKIEILYPDPAFTKEFGGSLQSQNQDPHT